MEENCLTCCNCIPIGEGDHVCIGFDRPFLIIDSYEPVEGFYLCKGEQWEAKG